MNPIATWLKGFLTPSQAEAIIAELSDHFGLIKPTGYYVVIADWRSSSTYGLYVPETNELVISILAPNMREALLHEFAHYLAYSRDTAAEAHGEVFQGALSEVEKACRS